MILCAAIVLRAGSTAFGGQQDRMPRLEEPQWLRLRINEVSVGAYAEGDFESTRYRDSNTEAFYERLFIGPLLGLNINGSVYHPNLLSFQLNGEGSAGWGYETVQTSSTRIKRDELEWLGRFNASAQIFDSKPINGTLWANYDHTFRDYDFFSRMTVDSWRYGGRATWHEGPWHLTLNYSRRDEDVYGRPYDVTVVEPVIINGVDTGAYTTNNVRRSGITTSSEDVLGFDARHERGHGGTTFNYTLNRYSREDAGVVGEGIDHYISLGDTETFGLARQHTFTANASYLHRENTAEPSQEITLGASLNLEHRPDRLWSRYDLHYDRYETGAFASDNYLAHGELKHQLYDSLTSTLILEGARNDVADAGFDSGNTHFGMGFQESYSKRLSSVSRLRVDNYFMATHVDADISGGIIPVRNELHAFPSAGGGTLQAVFLSRPNVRRNTIVVWSADRTREYTEGIHYTVRENGALTQIVPIIGGGVPIERNISVDYEADSATSGSYQTFNELVQVRFDLWNDLWGAYFRLNWLGSNAGEDMRVQDLLSYTIGTDASWRGFRAGAEYEMYDSSFSEYNTFRLFQAVSVNLDDRSTIGADFGQSWTDYTDSDRQESTYTFISRFRTALTGSLGVGLEGGIMVRRGDGVDQDMATARPAIDYVFGKTTIRAEYNFEYDLFLRQEERYRHMFVLRWRRVF